jgi:hypothetical protein
LGMAENLGSSLDGLLPKYSLVRLGLLFTCLNGSKELLVARVWR